MKSRNGVLLLGEFLVVVLGILGAFAIEDWSARRADRALERDYLEQLQRDLEADAAEMDENRLAALLRALTVGQVMEEAGLEFEPMESPAFGGPIDFADTLAVGSCPSLTSCLANYRTFDGSRAAYDELVNTGNLRVMKSRSLVRALAIYYARMVSEIDGDENLGRPDVLALGRALNRHGFPVNRGASLAKPDIGDLVVPVRNDAELRALLLQVRYTALWQIARIELTRTQLRDVLEQLETELAGTN